MEGGASYPAPWSMRAPRGPEAYGLMGGGAPPPGAGLGAPLAGGKRENFEGGGESWWGPQRRGAPATLAPWYEGRRHSGLFFLTCFFLTCFFLKKNYGVVEREEERRKGRGAC